MKVLIFTNSKKAKVWLFFALITVAILCLFSVNLAAQSSASDSTSSSSSGSTSTEQETEQLIKKKRRLPFLNGHTYIASATMPQTPFVTTYFRNSTGIGSALGFDIPVYDPEGEFLTTVDGKLTYMMLEISYQQAINDWLAVWLSGAGVGRVGLNAESVLSKGLSGVGAIELGGLARILHKDKFILSGAFSLRHNKQIGVDIIGFAKSIIDTGIIDEANLLTRIPSWRYKGGLRFAYAVNDLLGFIVTTDLGFGDNLEGKDKRDTVFDIGGLASLDLNTRTKIPIGLLLGYSHTSYPESSGDIIERVGVTTLRIAYTGSREFSLGLEFSYASAPLKESDQSLNYSGTYINLQYYF
ncbi:MAG: hypothetical protein GQ544_01240 [Candidatus Aminicenantes bacterium]|nr:hypothetical protein [Candidatus Aminicenantes bacterium]